MNEKNKNIDFRLDQYEKKLPFKTPKNYFENLEDQVMHDIEMENNSIPKDYFSNLEDEIFNKINEQDNVKTISIWEKITDTIPQLLAAASIILFASALSLNINKSSNFTLLDDDEIELWIEQDYLVNSDNDISFIYESIDVDNLNYNKLEEDELEDYLENINLEEL